MISIKSEREIALMKEAGRVVALVFDGIKDKIKPGLTTLQLADICENIIRENGAIPTFKDYQGFKGAVCISINEELVHGTPSAHRVLKNGDIVSVDVGATKHGFVADACRTYPVGVVSQEAMNLMKVTKEAFFEGCKVIKEGVHLGDVSNAIQTYVEAHGYSLPREFSGHGVGEHLHEDPMIFNYGPKGVGPILKAGMTLAIEPMVALGRPEVRIGKDGWVARMKDGKLSSHYENSIVVTKDGYEILTRLED